jgi:hypothetical protein
MQRGPTADYWGPDPKKLLLASRRVGVQVFLRALTTFATERGVGPSSVGNEWVGYGSGLRAALTGTSPCSDTHFGLERGGLVDLKEGALTDARLLENCAGGAFLALDPRPAAKTTQSPVPRLTTSSGSVHATPPDLALRAARPRARSPPHAPDRASSIQHRLVRASRIPRRSRSQALCGPALDRPTGKYYFDSARQVGQSASSSISIAPKGSNRTRSVPPRVTTKR